MTKWDVYRFVARSLRPIVGGAGPSDDEPIPPWEEIVAASSHHLVAPALGWCFAGSNRIPSDAADYFAATLALNRNRNAKLREGLRLAREALAVAGIAPVLLKGAASLVEGLYPDDGIRVLGDLDLLVRKEELSRADQALARAGFVIPPTEPWRPADHHHLPTRIYPAIGAGIELHHGILPPRFAGLMDSRACFERSRVLSGSNGPVRILAPDDRILHVIRGQLVDGHLGRGVPQLRQMLELALLIGRSEESVEPLHELGDPTVRQVLAQCSILLGSPALPQWVADSAERRMEKALTRSRSGNRMAELSARLASAPRQVRERPSRLFRLLLPSVWTRLLFPSPRSW